MQLQVILPAILRISWLICLWEIGKWYAASFVWSRSAVPVFTVENEVAYLAAFTSSVMVEISRLDAIIANRMKSDFISSISREINFFLLRRRVPLIIRRRISKPAAWHLSQCRFLA
jgi:hypothetical protein